MSLEIEITVEVEDEISVVAEIEATLLTEAVTIINSEEEVLGTAMGGEAFEVDDSLIKRVDGTTIESVPAEQYYTVADTHVKDSAGTLLHEAKAAGPDVTITDSPIRRSDATLIVNVKAQASLTIANTIVKNTLGTQLASVMAESTDVTISDVTHTDSNGSPVVKADHVPFVATPCPTPTPITYAWPLPTGQTTSYRTGDDAYIFSLYFANLVQGKINTLVDFTTLVNNNSFGNTNRFTDSLGAQLYGVGNAAVVNYVVDNYTGLGWNRLYQTTSTWNNAITNGLASAFGGYSGWFCPSINQLNSIRNMQATTRPLNYAPFNLGAAVDERIYSSTTNFLSTVTAVGLFLVAGSYGANISMIKTDAEPYMICRKHF